jgi:hypothetical protein
MGLGGREGGGGGDVCGGGGMSKGERAKGDQECAHYLSGLEKADRVGGGVSEDVADLQGGSTFILSF